MIPATIYKHWIGYVFIALAAIFVLLLLWLGFDSIIASNWVDPTLAFGLYAFASVIVVLVAIVQIYVYGLSYIELNSTGIVVKNWITLFVSRDESFEWVQVSRATVSKGEIFAQLLNYGSIGIETNGGQVQVVITRVPNVEYWQDIIQAKADESTPDETP